MKRLLVLLFCVLYAIGGKAHVDCVRDGSEHEAKRSKAYSPTSTKRLEANFFYLKTYSIASLTRARPNLYRSYNQYSPILIVLFACYNGIYQTKLIKNSLDYFISKFGIIIIPNSIYKNLQQKVVRGEGV